MCMWNTRGTSRVGLEDEKSVEEAWSNYCNHYGKIALSSGNI